MPSFKSVSARLCLTEEQNQFFREKMYSPFQAWLIRLFLHNYEGRDDGLQQEIAPQLGIQEFADLCTDFRNGLLLDKKSTIKRGQIWKAPDDEPREEVTPEKLKALEPDPADDEKTAKRKERKRKKLLETDDDEINGCVSSRALTAPLFGDSKVGYSTLLCRKTLYVLRQLGILPLLRENEPADEFSIVEGAIEFVRSYVACDRKTRIAWAEEEDKLARLQAFADKPSLLPLSNMPENEEEAEEENLAKPDNSGIKGIIREVRRLQGKDKPKKKKGRKIKVVVPDDPEKPPMTVKEALDILVKKQESRMEKLRSSARLTLPTKEQPLPYRLGSNFCDFALATNGPRMLLTVKTGSLRGTYEAAYGTGKLKGGLIRHLQITPIPGATSVFQLEYMENGKRPRLAKLKEPRIIYRKGKKNSGFYLMLSLSIETQMSKMFYGEHCWYNRMWPKPVEDVKELVDMRVMGVDLGIDPIFAWAVLEGKFENGEATDIKVLETGKINRSSFSDQIKELEARVNDLTWIIRTCVGARTHGSTMEAHMESKYMRRPGHFRAAVQRLFGDCDAFFKHVNELPMVSWTSLGEEESKDKTMSAALWHRNNIWQAGDKLREIRSKYREIRDKRRLLREENIADNLQWQSLSRALASLITAWHRSGTRMKSGPQQDNFLRKFHETKFNDQQDNRKKECRAILDRAMKYGVHILAIEDLERERDVDHHLWDLWSANSMMTLLVQMANNEGIGVVRVQPDCTSKTVYGSWLSAWRDDENKRRIFYLQDGKVIEDDCDINSAKSIAYLGMTRQKVPLYFWVREVAGKIVPLQEEATPAILKTFDPDPNDDEKTAQKKARRRAKLASGLDRWKRAKALFGDFSCFQHLCGELDEEGANKIYRHGDTWITAKQRDVLIEEIEAQLLKQQPQAAE